MRMPGSPSAGAKSGRRSINRRPPSGTRPQTATECAGASTARCRAPATDCAASRCGRSRGEPQGCAALFQAHASARPQERRKAARRPCARQRSAGARDRAAARARARSRQPHARASRGRAGGGWHRYSDRDSGAAGARRSLAGACVRRATASICVMIWSSTALEGSAVCALVRSRSAADCGPARGPAPRSAEIRSRLAFAREQPGPRAPAHRAGCAPRQVMSRACARHWRRAPASARAGPEGRDDAGNCGRSAHLRCCGSSIQSNPAAWQ